MLLLAAALATVTPSGPAVQTSARAVVRILAPATVSAKEWNATSPQLRRETSIRGANGETVRARLIEYQ